VPRKHTIDFFAVFSAIAWNCKSKFYRHIESSYMHITVLLAFR